MARSFTLVALASVALLTACGGAPAPTGKAPAAFPSIDGNRVLEHTKTLASDEFEGRKRRRPR